MSKNDDDLRPSWVPEEPNPEFACSVVRGIDSAVNSVTGAKEYPDAVHSVSYTHLTLPTSDLV